MKFSWSQIGKQLRVKHPLTLVIAVVVLVAGGFWLYTATKPHVDLTEPAINGQTPTPSPGTPGNAGDAAKSDQGKNATPSPTPVPTTVSGAPTITVSDFNITPRSGGTAVVQNDVVSGVTSGACSLALTSPSDNPQIFTGQVTSAGSYYSCSFGTITGISETGTWKASLSVTSGGSTGKANDTTFEVQ
jgi:hypothetical protein